jgi:hypothetical protein
LRDSSLPAADGAILHALQRQRDQGDDHQGVEDHRRQDRALRAVQMHDVQRAQGRQGDHEHRRDDGEVLGHVVGDREGRQGAAGDQHLLADLDDLDDLGRVAVEVDHVAGLAGGLGAGLHGHADIGLGQGGRVVGAVAAHGDQPALALLLADQPQLVLGRGLGQEVVDAGFRGDGGGGHRVVAGDHHRAQAHAAQVGEAFLDVGLDHVLQVDDADQGAVLADRQRRAARAGDTVDGGGDLGRDQLGIQGQRAVDGVHRALAPRHAVVRPGPTDGSRR